MKTCLLVIDVQASFRHRACFSDDDVPEFLQAQNALIAGCMAQDVPVVRVLHHEPQAPASDPFSPASGHVVPLQGLKPFDAAATFYKTRHSALVASGLDCSTPALRRWCGCGTSAWPAHPWPCNQATT